MKILWLEIEKISLSPYQPRKSFDEEAIDGLASSIAEVGLLHPPLVCQNSVSGYELIAGERRLRAAKRLGWKRIPALVIETSPGNKQARSCLVENLQRVDLGAMEIAHALFNLQKEFGFTHEELARSVGKKRSSVTNYLRLLKLHADLQLALTEGTLTFGHARLLATLEATEQLKWLRRLKKRPLSVHDFEKALTQPLRFSKKSKPILKDAFIDLRESLVHRYGLHVQIKYQEKNAKGTVTFYFNDPRDLQKLLGESEM